MSLVRPKCQTLASSSVTSRLGFARIIPAAPRARRMYRSPRWHLAIPLTATLAVTLSCGGDAAAPTPPPPPPPPPPEPTTVSVTPAEVGLMAGDSVQLAAEVRDQNGAVMTGATVAWSSSDAAVATVTSGGLVRGSSAGSATITATAGQASGTAAVTVSPPPPEPTTVSVTPAEVGLAAGDSVQLAAEVRDQNEEVMTDATVAWSSSDTAVATVTSGGLVRGSSAGSATITATAGQASGTAAVTVSAAPAGPEVAAPVPTQAADDVTSLFSDAYDDATVDTWSADWDQADVEDVMVAGDAVKKYANLVFAGIEFTSAPVDASDMTHFHIDIWTPDPTAAPAVFKVKLVDFGANGSFQGGDDSEHEMSLTAESDPPLATGSWVSYDLALADFTGLAARANLAQLIISGDPNTVYVDNLYFWRGDVTPGPTEPEVAAPVPTQAADDVTSLFSDAYDDATVDTWSAEWDQADVEDVMVAGDAVKKYSNLAFAGIEFTSAPVDASDMTHFHIDIWTPDPTAAPAVFKVKLVDFGANGSFQGGDDSEHEMSLTAESDPPLATGSWVSYDLALADFTGLAARANLAQLIISGDPNTVYVDNLYFWRESDGDGQAGPSLSLGPASR